VVACFEVAVKKSLEVMISMIDLPEKSLINVEEVTTLGLIIKYTYSYLVTVTKSTKKPIHMENDDDDDDSNVNNIQSSTESS
jgi:hypothetical protein